MFIYLSFSGLRVELPTAVSSSELAEEVETVSFFDGEGVVIARFRRSDVAFFSHDDLPKMRESQSQES